MTPEHTALVARLELKEMHVGDTDKAAAAIRELQEKFDNSAQLAAERFAETIKLSAELRALAGAVAKQKVRSERWKAGAKAYMHERDALAGEVERLNASIATLNVFVTEILNERDTLRAEVAALRKDAERLDWAENHPEAAYAAISRWWAMAGPGYREVRFNFRNVIDGARAEGKP